MRPGQRAHQDQHHQHADQADVAQLTEAEPGAPAGPRRGGGRLHPPLLVGGRRRGGGVRRRARGRAGLLRAHTFRTGHEPSSAVPAKALCGFCVSLGAP